MVPRLSYAPALRLPRLWEAEGAAELLKLRRAVDPDCPERVAGGLRAYLCKHCGSTDLTYLAEPSPLPNGWETHTFSFRLQGPRTPDRWDQPLILRAYCSPQGLPRARHEFAVQKHMHALGYPVPEPLLLEENCNLFGGPFLIMERLPGQTFYRNLLYFSWMMWPRSAGMAAMQARLHALPTDGFPAPPGPFLERCLDEMRRLIRHYGLDGLVPGWDWLAAHRPPPPVRASILHLDYHPWNLLCTRFPGLSVLDWTEADVGDPHADVGTSLMLMHCCSAGQPTSTWERTMLPIGRFLTTYWYLNSYRKRAALDRWTLAYYRGLATLKRLCGYGRWLRATPLSTGCKPASLRYLNPHHLETMQDYFQRWTGVAVTLVPQILPFTVS